MDKFIKLNYIDSLVIGSVVGFSPAIMKWAISNVDAQLVTIISSLEGILVLMTLSFVKRININKRNAILGMITLTIFINISFVLSLDNPFIKLLSFTLSKGLFLIISNDLMRYLSNILLDQDQINKFDLNKRILMSISSAVVGFSMSTIIDGMDIKTLMIIETIILDISCTLSLLALYSIRKEVNE